MALDGIVIANIRQELEQTLLGGRLYKIAQPETDELLFTIKTPKQSTMDLQKQIQLMARLVLRFGSTKVRFFLQRIMPTLT